MKPESLEIQKLLACKRTVAFRSETQHIYLIKASCLHNRYKPYSVLILIDCGVLLNGSVTSVRLAAGIETCPSVKASSSSMACLTLEDTESSFSLTSSALRLNT